ncbi:hypothetical protein CWM47_24065 [Spirosoma pollinicola]|uniref:Uncharacterized protein n=1 Tax=Spirosoma pollinicola TaxID=2057025 RepID=A0A2K8Z466_9BACT|nr:hypothetical protein CWM47_24065 [Spirosoma pollinicola]
MKIPQNTYSFAYTANQIGFPGGAPNFIFWLRRHQYLLDDLSPNLPGLKLGIFAHHTQKLPGILTDHNESVTIPRLTKKGLTYFINKFERSDFSNLDSVLTDNLLS